MTRFFTRERFGHPQFIAGVLLLVFLAQCLYLAGHGVRNLNADPGGDFRVREGLRQWHGIAKPNLWIAGTTPAWALVMRPRIPELTDDGYDPHHSPLHYLIASAPLLVWPGHLESDSRAYWGWLSRAPYLLFGVLLGASLWYVSRRLYGNAGGYIALTLYCFSPGIIRSSAVWFTPPEMGAAWGAFGAIFTAIAVSHTLYAPREVVLWNWRRIVLLGLSLAMAIGSQFSLVILLPVVLGFLIYLAPVRKLAAVSIGATASGFALILLLGSYFFHPAVFWQGMQHAQFFNFTWRALTMPGVYQQLLTQLGQSCPALVIAVPAALIAYAAWPRARYFGNTAPLVLAGLFLLLGLAMPHYPGLGFRLVAVPLLFLFVAGVFADLLETRHRPIVLSSVWGFLTAYGIWSLLQLAHVHQG